METFADSRTARPGQNQSVGLPCGPSVDQAVGIEFPTLDFAGRYLPEGIGISSETVPVPPRAECPDRARKGIRHRRLRLPYRDFCQRGLRGTGRLYERLD